MVVWGHGFLALVFGLGAIGFVAFIAWAFKTHCFGCCRRDSSAVLRPARGRDGVVIVRDTAMKQAPTMIELEADPHKDEMITKAVASHLPPVDSSTARPENYCVDVDGPGEKPAPMGKISLKSAPMGKISFQSD